MLEINNITLEYADFCLTADIPPLRRGIYGLIGPSGCGKSSLLLALSGFTDLKSGEILWDGKDISRLPPSERPFSILFQDNNLFPHLSIKRNIALALTHKARLSAKEQDRVEKALNRVGLLPHAEKKPGQLSGGEQSRAALARVLLQRRPILLLDEPFAALGPGLKKDMLALTQEIAEHSSLTVIMVTHNVEDARQIAPETLLIQNGILLRAQDTHSLLDNPPSALRSYLGMT